MYIPIVCRISSRASSLVMWSKYEMFSSLQKRLISKRFLWKQKNKTKKKKKKKKKKNGNRRFGFIKSLHI